MKCCNCSREIPENSLYCNWCGKKQLREKEKKLKIPAPRQRRVFGSGEGAPPAHARAAPR